MPAKKKRSVVEVCFVRDETTHIPKRLGGGLLKEYVCQGGNGEVQRYSLVYINPAVHAGDNGRVLGYDNKHGFHHKHWFGAVTAEVFISFEDTARKFTDEWRAIAMDFLNRD